MNLPVTIKAKSNVAIYDKINTKIQMYYEVNMRSNPNNAIQIHQKESNSNKIVVNELRKPNQKPQITMQRSPNSAISSINPLKKKLLIQTNKRSNTKFWLKM